ncbi:glyoxalase/bleomycin resistance/extradiol dioxygenase family protein, partial [Flavobacterium circumlabens]
NDYGWMYQRTFFDPDGHHWEVFFMEESQIPEMS